MYDCASGGVPLSSDASKPHDDAYRHPRSTALAPPHQEHAQALDLNMNSGYSLYSQVGRRGSAVCGGGGGRLRGARGWLARCSVAPAAPVPLSRSHARRVSCWPMLPRQPGLCCCGGVLLHKGGRELCWGVTGSVTR